MPYINCRVIEGVLSDDQKAEIGESITETFVSVLGEPVRGLTWVVIDDMASGQLTIGGRPITTEGVKEVLTELLAQRPKGSGGVEQRNSHRAQRERSRSRSERVISRISSSKEVLGFQPRSRAALEGSPMRWSTSAGRTKA